MDDDDARHNLSEERVRLQGLRASLENDHLRDEGGLDSGADLSHVHQHLGDMASETFEREKEFSILEQVEAELTDVDRALDRLAEGSYGTCEACGHAIGDERLAVLPAARFCVDHQADLEV